MTNEEMEKFVSKLSDDELGQLAFLVWVETQERLKALEADLAS